MPANWMPSSGWNSSQPVNLARKSKCHHERRNSPSVASFRPIDACLCTTFSISISSTLRRSSADISPFSSLARASLMRGGRNRLPTSSARKGAFVLCIVSTPGNLMCRGARDAEEAFVYRGIGLQGGTRRIVNDCAALQYHDAVGQPQNLLCILLDDDRTDAAGAGDSAQRLEQLLDDDRSQPLGRLVEQQYSWIERERAADRQHLLLAAGELVAEIVAALLQPRKHLVDLRHRPRSRLRHRGHVLFHRQRAEDVALLRYPADTGPRPLVGPHLRDIQPAKTDGPPEAAGNPDDRIDQRGLAGAVAAQQGQHLAFREPQRHVRQYHRFAVAGAQVLDAQEFRHRRPRQDRPPWLWGCA